MRIHLMVAVIVCTVFLGLTACGERAVETMEDQAMTDADKNIEEQDEELMKPYWEAHDLAEKEIEEVTYTYEERFGSLSATVIQMYGEFLNGERCVGDADIYY